MWRELIGRIDGQRDLETMNEAAEISEIATWLLGRWIGSLKR